MKRYEVLDKNGKKIEINQRIPDCTGKWWYFAGYANSIKLLVKKWKEDDISKATAKETELFNVTVKPLPDYNIVTRQGFKVLQKWGQSNDLHIIIRRDHMDGTKDYAWCTYYDLETGTWVQGHYDYTNAKDAQKALLRFMYELYVD